MADLDGFPVAIDLFSGAGGLSEGLLAAGINVAVAVEGHPHPALTHAFNHPGTTVLCGDIRKLSIDTLKHHVKKRTGRTKVDLVAGGPPCQGFSPAGNQDRNDPRNSLYKEFLRVVEQFTPRMFLFENVPGFAQLYESEAIHRLLDAFWSLGYRMHAIDNDAEYYPEDYPTLNAVWYGVPQRRRRFLLVGWRDGKLERPFAWPTPTHGNSQEETGSFQKRYEGIRLPPLTVEDAIGDLAFLSGGSECHSYQSPPSSKYQCQRRQHSGILFNHLATKHRKATVDMFRRLVPGKTIRSIPKEYRSGKQRMRRLTPNDASSAILALPDDYVHFQRHRILTVREMARLQSFDDDYVFLGKRTTSDLNRRVDVPQYTQVGNAVPPILARALGMAIIRALGGRQRDLRMVKLRQKRHDWVCGSSGFHGYTLAPLAEGKIALYDASGKPMPLPISKDAIPANRQVTVVDWMKSTRRTPKPIVAVAGGNR